MFVLRLTEELWNVPALCGTRYNPINLVEPTFSYDKFPKISKWPSYLFEVLLTSTTQKLFLDYKIMQERKSACDFPRLQY